MRLMKALDFFIVFILAFAFFVAVFCPSAVK
jgi:hypothetical protein